MDVGSCDFYSYSCEHTKWSLLHALACKKPEADRRERASWTLWLHLMLKDLYSELPVRFIWILPLSSASLQCVVSLGCWPLLLPSLAASGLVFLRRSLCPANRLRQLLLDSSNSARSWNLHTLITGRSALSLHYLTLLGKEKKKTNKERKVQEGINNEVQLHKECFCYIHRWCFLIIPLS